MTLTAPDGSATIIQYLTTVTDPASITYTGYLTKTTDPAGKWKTRRTDAMGNLVQMLEPNPDTTNDRRYLTTNYTYNAIGQMTQVFMRRYAPGSHTNYTDQTRTFAYSGSDMISATNPENGTVTYQYDGAHRVTKRTDAKGQETRYSYDAYGRLTQVQHWSWFGSPTLTLQEVADERIDYYYDTNPCDGGFSQNAWGRLAAVNFTLNGYNAGCRYQYSYNTAGRVTSQKMAWTMQNDPEPASYAMTAGYEWDNEGRMTSLTYPALNGTGTKYSYSFDDMGRTSGMSGGGTASATFGVAGEIQTLSYFGMSETRQYNSLYQMTRQTVSGLMDMQYIYTAAANNGRIAKSIDGVTGETVDYTYDVWNRLTKAETEGTGGVQWGQSFTYDGFGNLYAKGVTKGSAPSFNVDINQATNGGPTSYAPTAFDGTTDVENRPLTGWSNGDDRLSYSYDQAGKRVLMRTYPVNSYWFSGTWEFAMYGLGGQRLQTVTCTYPAPENVHPNCVDGGKNIYFGGKLVVSRGVTVATDRLGTVRSNGTESFAYYPYGEERTTTADGREKFGTYVRDSAGQDYADQRTYGVGTGRFATPDPSAGVDPGRPPSWNRYLYVVGDPVNFRDHRGLNVDADPWYCAPEYSYEDCYGDWPGGGGGGGGGGGFVEPHGPEGTGPWMTTAQRNSNVALLQALAAASVAVAASSTPRDSYVAYLMLTGDCYAQNADTGGITRNRTYQAYDQDNNQIDATITERVFLPDGNAPSSIATGSSGSEAGVYKDHLGLSVFQTGTQLEYQYFVTTIPGTTWVNVPTEVRTPANFYYSGSSAQVNMVYSITLSNSVNKQGNHVYDANISGVGGMAGLKPCK